MNSTLLLLTILSLPMLSGCSIATDILGGSDDTWEGRVAFGFEVSSFSPCSSDAQWWMTGGGSYTELNDKYRDLGQTDYMPVYAKLKGTRSSKGRFGHLGEYEREFEVVEVVDVRELKKDECAAK